MGPGRDIRGPACGLLAASLFGLSAPLGKVLVSHAGPVALASVLYLSAGIVLSLIGPLRDRSAEAPLRPGDAPVLAAIAVLGGIIGPVLMLYGLARVSGVTGALLLNLEAPATILLAVCVFGFIYFLPLLNGAQIPWAAWDQRMWLHYGAPNWFGWI